MIFRQYQQVLDKLKTQTRRLQKEGDYFSMIQVGGGLVIGAIYDKNCRLRWKVGRTYAIQPGRGKKSVGRFLLKAIRDERVQDISLEDIVAEGYPFTNRLFCESLVPIVPHYEWFIMLWNSIHKKPDTCWEGDPPVWALEMELVG